MYRPNLPTAISIALLSAMSYSSFFNRTEEPPIRLDHTIRTRVLAPVEWTEVKLPQRLVAISDKCDGRYSRLEIQYPDGTFSEKRLDELYDDRQVKNAVKKLGWELETEFDNCGKPSNFRKSTAPIP